MAEKSRLSYCSQPPRTVSLTELDPTLDPNLNRLAALVLKKKKWIAGSTVTWAFMSKTSPENGLDTTPQRNEVQQAWMNWKNTGINLVFQQVEDPNEAILRIAFTKDGSWSYVGTDNLNIPKSQHTMNFGWNLTAQKGTAEHEIGHALGLEHEHQNPGAGIKWNVQEVLLYFSGPPNNWSYQKIKHNILAKLNPKEVEGSKWDVESIMHYQFDAGLILNPPWNTKETPYNSALSPKDVDWIKKLYPTSASSYTLSPGQRVLQMSDPSLSPGSERIFSIVNVEDGTYEIQTLGDVDTLLVLERSGPNGFVKIKADDDSGIEGNAKLRVELKSGEKYRLLLRYYFAQTNHTLTLEMSKKT